MGGSKMTQEEKSLLLIDLCGRVSYHVMVCINDDKNAFPLMGITFEKESKIFNCPSRYACKIGGGAFSHTDVRPYLRPMSSMTEEEKEEFDKITLIHTPWGVQMTRIPKLIDWLNAHHFDYRGLIEMGLALPAPEGMYSQIAA